jgi:uncharacterized membrane protein
MKLSKSQRSKLSTLLGLIVAIANAWVNVDWTDFQFNVEHIAPLIVSAAIALGGYMTSINTKTDTNKYEGNI